jgi:glycosyltransferase involved in cell wall biosynthesis
MLPTVPAEGSTPGVQPHVAVLIPCYNEEITIAEVVGQFRSQLPDATVYVFDNNSSDRTVERALEAGARVLHERRQGKGYVVQSIFRRVEADVYVIVDGDGTYQASAVHTLISPILSDEADMVVGCRLHAGSQSQFKHLNRWGNRLVLSLLNLIFRLRLTDVLSGYRAFNRKFVKNLNPLGSGFEIETELTIKAVARGYRIVEVPVDLTPRLAGSHSKIQFVRDGTLILATILTLFRDYKPLTFFGSLGLLLIGGAFIPGLMIFVDFLEKGVVERLPLAVLAAGLTLSGMLLITVGLLLHSIARRAQEFECQLQMLRDELRDNASSRSETR